jgi:flagellar hook-length control protein FliK
MAILSSLGTTNLAASGTGLLNATSSDTATSNLTALSRAFSAKRGLHPAGAAGMAEDDNAGDKSAKGVPTSLGDGLATLLDSGETTDTTDLSTSVTDTTLVADPPMDASTLLAQAAQWPTAPTEASGDAANSGALDTAPANLAGAVKLPRVLSAVDAGGTGASALGDAVSELAGKAVKSQKDALARFASAQSALATPPTEVINPAAEARQTQWVQKVAETSVAAITTTQVASATVALPRREEYARERSVFRANTTDNTSSASQSYMPSVSGTSGASAPEPATPTDTYIAEKVAYWISNDVQNAEMKLDGIGDKPVEVSIRMQGNEAHIAFRSDELQARAALESASQHLKDMLQREGLVLSGVSVGTSGAGDSGEQERKSRQGARHSGVASVQPARIDRSSGVGGAAGRSGGLDLFV